MSEEKLKSSDSRYLEKLEFREELRKGWLNFFVTNFRVVLLLIALISAWGLYAFFELPRESNPEVKIPIAMVVTAYPGAGPSDVEELVTKKIETAIGGVSGVEKITSRSANSLSAVTVEFSADQDLTEAIRSVRDKVADINSDLPEDATEAQVSEISFDDRPIMSIALSGPFDALELRAQAEKIQDELEKIEGVREVNVSGGDERELSVSYDPGKLAALGVTIEQANAAIRSSSHAMASGNFDSQGFTYPIRVDARFTDARSLGDLPVGHKSGGALILLSDVAKVEEKAIERTTLSRLSTEGSIPQQAVTIDVVKRSGGSIIKIADSARQKTAEMVAGMPQGTRFDVTTDFAKYIREDFDRLTHDFLLTLALVFAILFFIVGLKEALVAGLAVPLVFFVSFGVMLASGISLNFLSIFSLILALGLLVDDAIVVVSATKQYLKTGKFTPEEAVLLVLNDFKVVLTTTTLATTWAFLPLLLATGMIGEFIKSIPITVSVTLVSSLLIALMINHPLAAVLERVRLTRTIFLLSLIGLLAASLFALFKGGFWGWSIGTLGIAVAIRITRWYLAGGKKKLEQNKELSEREWKDATLIKEKLRTQGETHTSFGGRLIHGIADFDRLIPVYEKMIRSVLASKKRRMGALLFTFALFLGAVALPISGIVQSEFFPASDEDTIYVTIEGPIGLSLEKTDELAAKAEEKILPYKEIKNFSTLVGQAIKLYGSSQHKSSAATIIITLTDKEERSLASYELADSIRADLAHLEGANVTVESVRGGPPAGAAFEARISGEDLPTLERIATDLKEKLDSIEGVSSSDISLKAAPAEYTFTLNPQRLELYSLSPAAVGSFLRTAISGTEITTITQNGKDVSVVARLDKEELPSLDALGNLEIINSAHNAILLKDVAHIELRPSLESITRTDGERTATISAGVSGKTNPATVLKAFQEKLAREYALPEGYAVSYGGENEQNAESVKSILRAMLVAALLIISTLVIQFNSFIKPLLVLVTLPLALIGVFVGMAIFGVNLSFPGLIGILALFGIVVKNAIILIDKIDLNIRFGIPFGEAVIDAGKSRLEAIFITSICTIAGIIPITLSNELWTALGSAIIFGLSVSSLLTLFIVPVMYVSFVKEK